MDIAFLDALSLSHFSLCDIFVSDPLCPYTGSVQKEQPQATPPSRPLPFLLPSARDLIEQAVCSIILDVMIPRLRFLKSLATHIVGGIGVWWLF